METKTINKGLIVGGQPSAEDIEKFHKQGIRTVVNLRTEDEDGYLPDEERLVEGAGLNYTEISVSPELLDDMAVQRFSQALSSTDSQPAYIHCQGGGRAGMMTLLHLAIEHGWSIKRTYQEGEKLGISLKPNSPYREFFENYLKRHSPAER